MKTPPPPDASSFPSPKEEEWQEVRCRLGLPSDLPPSPHAEEEAMHTIRKMHT